MAKRRKPGSGNQIGDHLWEGRYSPGGPDGKQSSRNVYGHIPEECEEKLRVLIAAMKAKKETPADAGVFLSVVFLWSNGKIAAVRTAAISSFGGPDRIRTDDPHNANVMRSQLRYRPKGIT